MNVMPFLVLIVVGVLVGRLYVVTVDFERNVAVQVEAAEKAATEECDEVIDDIHMLHRIERLEGCGVSCVPMVQYDRCAAWVQQCEGWESFANTLDRLEETEEDDAPRR